MKNSVFSITTKMDKDETKEAKGSIDNIVFRAL